MFGYSIYLSTPLDETITTISKMNSLNPSYVFTSLHIPEEELNPTIVKSFFDVISSYNVPLVVDISPVTLKTLSISSIYELKNYPIKALRIDYGFSMEEIIELSHTFEIILNASTLNETHLRSLQTSGIDLNKLCVLHNFYPRKETGLSISYLNQQNMLFHRYGVKTMAFIPGDNQLRQPLFEGLPTVEKHRFQNPLVSYLDLIHHAATDVVLIGDISLKDETIAQFYDCLINNIYTLAYKKIQKNLDTSLIDQIYHNRLDAAEQVIRAKESRLRTNKSLITPKDTLDRPFGSITMDNINYGRYAGEIQITLENLEACDKVNVIGYIEPKDLLLLSYIGPNQKFKLISK